MGYPKGIPPSPPQGGGGGRSKSRASAAIHKQQKNPTVTHSGVVVLFIPFLASTLLHNHNHPNYLLQQLQEQIAFYYLSRGFRILLC